MAVPQPGHIWWRNELFTGVLMHQREPSVLVSVEGFVIGPSDGNAELMNLFQEALLLSSILCKIARKIRHCVHRTGEGVGQFC